MPLTQLGRYNITGTLGRGAMGVVYQAHDPLIERTVALKVVSCAGLTPDESTDFEARFLREAKSAGQLNHPNIVTIHDVGRSDHLSYIAMEFLVGRSLRDLLDSGTVLPVERIVQITAEIADGLAFAHAHDIVHRDIKPANIMVLDQGGVKITDFGIALLPSSSLTLVGTAMGTPKYMSPEQVLGRKADGRSDIFSLGAMLYEMLTGRPPFTGEALDSILYQVLNISPAPPSSLNPGLPPGFDQIIARAMAKEAGERYATASELATDLRQVHQLPGLLPQSAEAKPLPPLTKPRAFTTERRGSDNGESTTALVPKPAPRYGRIIAGLAALIVMTAAASWYGLRPSTPAAPATPASVVKPEVVAPAERAKPLVSETPRSEPVATTPAESNGSDGSADAPTPAPVRPAREARRAAKQSAAPKETAASEPAKAPAGDWLSALRQDMQRCAGQSFFRHTVCIEKARWRHCPGHWATVDECPGPTKNN